LDLRITGEWRKLHNEELYDLYCSTNITMVKKNKKNEMGWACGMDRGEVHTVFCWG